MKGTLSTSRLAIFNRMNTNPIIRASSTPSSAAGISTCTTAVAGNSEGSCSKFNFVTGTSIGRGGGVVLHSSVPTTNKSNSNSSSKNNNNGLYDQLHSDVESCSSDVTPTRKFRKKSRGRSQTKKKSLFLRNSNTKTASTSTSLEQKQHHREEDETKEGKGEGGDSSSVLLPVLGVGESHSIVNGSNNNNDDLPTGNTADWFVDMFEKTEKITSNAMNDMNSNMNNSFSNAAGSCNSNTNNSSKTNDEEKQREITFDAITAKPKASQSMIMTTSNTTSTTNENNDCIESGIIERETKNKNNTLNNTEDELYILSKKIVKEIDIVVEACNKLLPSMDTMIDIPVLLTMDASALQMGRELFNDVDTTTQKTLQDNNMIRNDINKAYHKHEHTQALFHPILENTTDEIEEFIHDHHRMFCDVIYNDNDNNDVNNKSNTHGTTKNKNNNHNNDADPLIISPAINVTLDQY